jgi:hypothetical protein
LGSLRSWTIKDGGKPSVGRSFFMKILLRLLLMATVLTGCCSTFVEAQTATVIPANEAAAHVGEYATVEGVVAKVFTSKSGNTFLNIGASYPNQTFTGWIPPASPVNKSPMLVQHRRKARQDHWSNRNLQGQAGNSDQCGLSTRSRVNPAESFHEPEREKPLISRSMPPLLWDAHPTNFIPTSANNRNGRLLRAHSSILNTQFPSTTVILRSPIR